MAHDMAGDAADVNAFLVKGLSPGCSIFMKCYVVSSRVTAYKSPQQAKKALGYMLAGSLKSGAIDRVAIGLSGLCVIHCLATAIFLAVVSAAGGLLLSPLIHEAGLVLAIGLGCVALGCGVAEHGLMMPVAIGGLGLGVMSGALTMPHDGTEVIFTMVGVALLALGHDLNRRAVI